MAAISYGTVAIVPKGEWNNGIQYKVGNLVSYNGSSYVARIQPPIGTLPTDTNYWQISAQGGGAASEDAPGVVKPDGTTTEVDENGTISAKLATQTTPGIVKGSNDINIGEGGAASVNTQFEQATELANFIAGEAFEQVLGKTSKAIATLMNLDQNALLKNMLSSIDVNDATKVPTSAYIHTLVERIGMGKSLDVGTDLTSAVNKLNGDLSPSANISGSLITYAEGLSQGFHIIRMSTETTDMPCDFGVGYIIKRIQDIVILVYDTANNVVYKRQKTSGNWRNWQSLVTNSDLTQQLYIADSKNGICEIRWPFASSPNNYYFLRSVPSEKRTYYGYNEGSGDHIYYYLSGIAL